MHQCLANSRSVKILQHGHAAASASIMQSLASWQYCLSTHMHMVTMHISLEGLRQLTNPHITEEHGDEAMVGVHTCMCIIIIKWIRS